MGKPAVNRNSGQYYGDRIYCTFLIHEGCLTFWRYYEGDSFFTITSMWYSEGDMRSFQKISHSSQRQSSGNCTRSCSTNPILYQGNHNQISSLPEFRCKWWRQNQKCWNQGTDCRYFYKSIRSEVFLISILQAWLLVGKRYPYLQGSLILHAWSGYLRRFISKGLKWKTNLINFYPLTRSIHHYKYRQKGAQSYKRS